MRVPTRPRGKGLKFNITPLIDVVFNLIIFFLVASHFVRSEKAEAVDLPEATQVQEEQEQSRNLIVTITPDERLQVGGEFVRLEQVDQMILAGRTEHGESFEVRVRADKSVAYRVVEPILLASVRAGVSQLKFAVIAK